MHDGPSGVAVTRSVSVVRFLLLAVAVIATASPVMAQSTPITFIQGNYAVPQTPQSVVSVAFNGAQSAGNLNVVAVGWNDSAATVTSVTDSRGNAYSLAVGPTVMAGKASHAIYYARNIGAAGAGGNVVTVRFNVAAIYPDVRILEYGGLDVVSPLVGSAGAFGTGSLSNSGAVAVTTANVLLVGANVVETVTSGAGANFTRRMITSPNGDIAEDRIVAAAGTYNATAPLSSGYWVMQLVAFKAGSAAPPPSDTTPPSVAITAPAASATVSGTVTVAAIASDDVAVVGLQFKVDGVNIGPEVAGQPYFVSWNTTTVADGTHVITAVARDGSNVTTSSPVAVAVSNATGTAPPLIGQWSAPAAWPLVAVHSTLLPNGQVLVWDGARQNGAAYVWDPSADAFIAVSPPDNIFCAGHCLLADGRAFVVGGHITDFVGIQDSSFFDPSNRIWSAAPPMAFGRWYPTATLLPDGRVLVVSGSIDCEECIAEIPEIYDPATNTWSSLPNAALALPLYPHLFVLPDGRVLATGAFEGPGPAVALDLTLGTWSMVDPVVVDGGSSAMYRLEKILKSGTSANSDPPYVHSQPTTYVLDMAEASPRWRETPPMAFGRAYHNLTLLPDGSVLATGGGQVTDPFAHSQAVLAAEIWSPTTETWTTAASMTIPRLYHSTALLLPDGRVLVAGGGRFGNPAGDVHDRLSAEIYSPPYLFKGSRPIITSVATTIPYGFTFSVATPDASRIASVVLVRLGSVTHNFNQSQRVVSLAFQQIGNSLNVQAPTSANEALPGHYMLFVVDESGVPSVAPIVRLQ
jgi:hypothetical protein